MINSGAHRSLCAPAVGNSVERHATDLGQEVKNLVDEHVGSCRRNVARAQRRKPVCSGHAVEVGKIDDEQLPQADELADQVAAALPGAGRQPATLPLGQRLRNCASSRGDGTADQVLESIGGWGFGWRRGGRNDIDRGSEMMHDALSEGLQEH